jgi:hypothetical protein
MLANRICFLNGEKTLHVALADLKIYLTINFVATRRAAAIFFVIVAATSISMPVQGQSPDDSLRIYAVNVVKTTPFEEPFTGDGIYLGKGAVITAAHVIGRWGFLKNPHVLIAGQSLPAKIIKEGSAEQIDLTLLSVDEARLPVSLRLRRNPLCKQPPRAGENVIVVVPDNTVHTQVISPQLIAPQFRMRFNTLIGDLTGGSGSGVFDAEKRCLMGIISRKVQKYDRKDGGRIGEAPVGFAGYFIPAPQIADFIPLEFRF